MFFSNWNKEPEEEKIYRWTEFFHKLDNSGWKMHTGARARKQKYICIYIYISIWKPFWKRVYEGWRSGESTHLSPMWLEFKSRHRSHMRFSPLLRDVFPWYIYSGFPLSGSKTNISKVQLHQECGCATSKSLFIIHLLIYLITKKKMEVITLIWGTQLTAVVALQPKYSVFIDVIWLYNCTDRLNLII